MPGLWVYSAPGGPFGKGGIPDRLNLWRGIFFAIEVKADRKNKPTDLQLHQLHLIEANGGIAAVLYGFEEHKLLTLREIILDRTPNFAVTNEIRGVPLPDQSRLFGIFTPEGDSGISTEQ